MAGRVLTVAGRPLLGVSLSIGKHVTRTDRDGRFVLRRVPSGHQVLLIDGSTATNTSESFGVFEDGVDLVNGKTNRLPYTTWMTALDVKHEVHFTYPITHTLTITNPQIPGLEVKIPAGSVLTNDAGKRVTELGITPISVNRPPFPLPVGVDVPIYFTVQPGSTYISKGARIIYPNYTHVPPGTRGVFWNYDPDHRGWYVYGHGTVTPNGKQVIPDPGVRVWEFTGAMWNPLDHLGPIWDAFQDLWNTATGDPVDPTTGLLNLSKTDMTEPGRLPLDVTRTYRQGDTQVRDFGVGQTFAYDMFLQSRDNAGVSHQYDWVDLILPSGNRIHFDRINGCPTHDSPCSDFQNGIFEADSTPTRYFHAQIQWRTATADGWNLTLQDGTVMHFGENAPLQDVTDRFGNKITISRTAGQDGAITQVTSSSGRWIHFNYNDPNCSSCVSQAVDQSGRTVNYTYSAAKQLTDVQDVDGNHTVYTWNPSAVDQITAIKDPRQNTYLQNTYDANDRVHVQTTPSGTFQFDYTVDGNNNVTQTDVTNPDGNVTRYVMNGTGVITSATSAYGTPIAETTTIERDPTTQRVTSTTDALSRKTTFSYFPDGNIQTATYLATSAHPLAWNYTWDPQFHQLASVTDPLNHSVNVTWTNGEATAVADGRGKQTAFAYNAYGERKSATDPLGHKWTFGYLNSDETSVTDPLGDVTTRQIDSAGRTTSLTDPAGQVSKYTYDAADNLVSATVPTEGQTQFHYDTNGNLDWMKDPLLNQTSFQYDPMNQLAGITDSAPTPKTASYTYYPSGLLQTYTDRRGIVTEYHYDALGRPSTIYLNKVGSNFDRRLDYTFDLGNRLTGVTDSQGGSPSATISRSYDGLDYPTNETVKAAGASSARSVVDYTYDDAGRPATMHVAGQTIVNYTFDAANRLTDIVQGSIAVHQDYDDANQLTDVQLPGSVSENFTEDTAGQVTGVTYKQGATTLGDLQYAYDTSGRRVGIGGTWSRVSLPAAVSGLTYDSANRLNSWGGHSLSYDANGNLTNDGTRSYNWDAANQLASVSQGGSTIASFIYDALGRRVSSALGGSTREYAYANGAIAQEEDGTGASIANSITSPVSGQMYLRTDSTGQRSVLADVEGSTLALTDASGVVQTSYTYSPFGDTTASGQTNANPFQYAGSPNDGTTTGLYLMGSRYYNPTMARFVSQDPTWFGAGQPNLYEYANDQPTGFTDPNGLGWTVEGCLGVEADGIEAGGVASICVSPGALFPGGQQSGASFTYGTTQTACCSSVNPFAAVNVSDACSIQQTGGPFSNYGASGGDESPTVGGHYFHGSSSGGPVHGVEVTVGGKVNNPFEPISVWDGTTHTYTWGGNPCPPAKNNPKAWKSLM